MTAVPRGHRAWWLATLVGLPLLLSAAAYASTLPGGFQGDDLEGIWRSTAFDAQMPSLGYPKLHWRPLADLSIRLDRSLHGLEPLGYRATNLVLNGLAAASVGLFSLVAVPVLERRPPRAAERASALVVAVVFAVWPTHSEAVAWVSGRGDVLATTCAMLALSSFVVGLDARRRRPSGHRWRVLLAGAAPLLTISALAAKESAVALPAIAALLAWRHLAAGRGRPEIGRSLRTSFMLAGPMLLATVWWFLLRRVVLGSFVGGFTDALGASGVVEVGLRGVWVVVRSFVPVVPVTSLVLTAVAAAVVVAVTAWRSQPGSASIPRDPQDLGRSMVGTAATLACCAFVATLPVAPLGVGVGVVTGERLTYLPSAFLLAAVGRCWLELLVRRAAVAWVSAAAVILVATLWTAGLAQRWRAAGDEAGRVTAALAALPPDRPAVVLGVRERTEEGIPVMLNALGPAVVVFHGWTDPSRLSDRHDGLPAHPEATTWRFTGTELQRLPDEGR